MSFFAKLDAKSLYKCYHSLEIIVKLSINHVHDTEASTILAT